jgi:hypothetical protein
MIVAQKLCILFVADTIIDENQFAAIFDQQASHGPGAKIVVIGRIGFRPERFGHNTEHGTAIQLEKTSVNHM